VIYADTSFLIALYLPEEGSARAVKWIGRHPGPLAFTPLHRHEFRTGVRLRAFRKDISEPTVKELFRELQGDLNSAVFLHTPIPWTDAFRHAEACGEKLALTLGPRSLDLLHIGIAQALKAQQFLTFDTRQREAAKAAGLRVEF
jgi:predicted nucleic acid-binding protein